MGSGTPQIRSTERHPGGVRNAADHAGGGACPGTPNTRVILGASAAWSGAAGSVRGMNPFPCLVRSVVAVG